MLDSIPSMKPASAKSCPSCGERYDADVLFCPRDGTPLASSRKNPAFSSVERDPYLGVDLGGQIQIRHLIGIGSMGRVYRAFQGGIERDVAVKILHRELSGNAELVNRFHHEAKIASRLVHPNVVQVLMTGSVPSNTDARLGGELYLVMEYLDGISLLSALAAAGTGGESEALPLPRALHIALQICDAVGEAHAQGIVHRDLKPENVMLVRRGEDLDYVKVLDFGIARLDWADKAMTTQAGLIFGTAKYISPEGAEGHAVGPPADVYSIATMLYQSLAGRAPFEGDSPVALLVQHTHAPPTELRSIARASYVPPPIAQVVMQNLSKKPSERAVDARSLGRDLALAVRASGLDPDEIAAQSGLLRSSVMVKLASKSRTKSLELSPSLAAQIGGIAAPTLESAQPPRLADLLPISVGNDAGDEAGRPTRDPQPHVEHAPSSPARASFSRSADGSAASPRPAADLDFGAEPARDSMRNSARDSARDSASTMQGVESRTSPRPRRARLARIVALVTISAAMGLIVVLGGRHLGGLGAAASSDSLEGHLARARECIGKHAWDSPPADNVKDITAEALDRWPSDLRILEVRREASERIVTDALGRKYAGDRAGAIRLAKLSLELHPALTIAQHLVAELEGSSPAQPDGTGLPQVAPAGSGAGGREPDRRPLQRRGAPDPRSPPGAQPAPASSRAGAAPAPQPSDMTQTGAGTTPVLPPTPPPLPADHGAPIPSSTGPWL